MRSQTLLTTAPLIDLGVVLQDLVEVCQFPQGLGAPEVGRATLAVSDAAMALARARAEASNTPDIQERVREALARAREALGAARSAVARARQTRGLAVELTAASIRLRQPRGPLTAVPALLGAWTTERSVTVACPTCARPCVIRYRYRFVEGLGARELLCPYGACGSLVRFHMPVNSFDVAVLACR